VADAAIASILDPALETETFTAAVRNVGDVNGRNVGVYEEGEVSAGAALVAELPCNRVRRDSVKNWQIELCHGVAVYSFLAIVVKAGIGIGRLAWRVKGIIVK